VSAATQSCCSRAPRLSVSELFERGFRRNRAAPLAIEGARCADREGLSACFTLDIAAGKITGIGFRASTCVTLLAYCELVAETMVGSTPRSARQLSPADLIAALPGVPQLKQSRALLAIAAFRAALAETADVATDHNEDALQ
jgi:NifU-like protein involved in Fe-S cluster formation